MDCPREFIKALAKAPANQIDPEVTRKLSTLSELEVIPAQAVKDILDECAHASLATDFAVSAMDVLWHMLLDQETTANS